MDNIITTSRAKNDLIKNYIIDIDDENNYLTTIDNQTLLALWICYRCKNDNDNNNNNNKKQNSHNKYDYHDDDDDDDDDIFINNYLKMLPTNLNHIPIFWSDDDLNELYGSVLYHNTINERNEYKKLYHYICNELDTNFSIHCSFEKFIWSKVIIESRAFRLRQDYMNDININLRDIGLVPYADMLNHKSRSNKYTCDWKVEVIEVEVEKNQQQQQQNSKKSKSTSSSSSFVIRAGPYGLKSGMEVYHSYGLHSNAHYLSKYGFSVEDDPTTTTTTQNNNNIRHDGLCPDEANIILQQKQNNNKNNIILQQKQNNKNKNNHHQGQQQQQKVQEEILTIRIGDEDNAIKLLAKLRRNSSSSADLQQQKKKVDTSSSSSSSSHNNSKEQKKKDHNNILQTTTTVTDDDDDDEYYYCTPISIVNERGAISKLLESVEKALSQYKTTYKEDLDILSQRTDDNNNNKKEETIIISSNNNKRNAVIVRFGEKNILLHWQASCHASLLCLHDVEQNNMKWSEYCNLLHSTLRQTKSIVNNK